MTSRSFSRATLESSPPFSGSWMKKPSLGLGLYEEQSSDPLVLSTEHAKIGLMEKAGAKISTSCCRSCLSQVHYFPITGHLSGRWNLCVKTISIQSECLKYKKYAVQLLKKLACSVIVLLILFTVLLVIVNNVLVNRWFHCCLLADLSLTMVLIGYHSKEHW